MKSPASALFAFLLSACAAGLLVANDDVQDPLPSWHDSASKKAIVDFVSRVTAANSVDFVDPSRRIATFDNDGTLWSEQPLYFQLFFAIDRVKALADEHPEWKTQEPFASLLRGETKQALAGGEESLMQLIAASHAGTTSDEFSSIVADWIKTAHHPNTGRRFTEMVYQPMLELLSYLRAKGFKTYIVSGGGIEFMRPWTEEVYGIPPEQVVGSSIKTKYEIQDGKPVIVRLPEINFIDDKEGKPVGILSHIGRRPLIAVGNSDGDFQMLEWATAGEGPRLGVLIHHTDADREWAYDRDSHIGSLNRGLDEGPERGWVIVDMKSTWKSIYPADR